jgi:hypothetical protein
MGPKDMDTLFSLWHFLAQSLQDTRVYNRIQDAHIA